ncbi:MAG: hypothetical protein ACD_58C00059G0001 [uncultured bacterium]|nr:MAG: hypothetical protein ACD_58C00059G0001 [uncultured bacterium]
MNKIVVYGSIICLVTLGGLFCWYQQTKSSVEEIDTQLTKIDKVNPNLLSSSGFKSVKGFTKNGNIPVKAQDSSISKANPFSY